VTALNLINSATNCAAVALALVFSLPANAAPQDSPVRAVWAVNDGEKVEKDDLSHPAKARNSAWDGKKIKLFGARNEIIAFQVIVEAGPKGARGLRAALPALQLRGGKAKIAYAPPAADPTNYAGRPVQLFSANYMNVTTPTTAGWIYRAGPGAPRDPTGWKPVQLVPENARPGKGGFPLDVEPNANQAIWIEVYSARNLPAGTYQGAVSLTADGFKTSVPVELELFDFTLPDENSLHAMLYYSGGQPAEYMGRNLDPEFHRFAKRQRAELVHAYSIESAKEAFGRLKGGDFTREKGYEGPGEGIGNTIVPASFYGPGRQYDERESAWKKSDGWMSFLNENLPRAITFLYMPDEPGPDRFEYIRKLADNIHSNPGPGRKLPVFVTRGYTEGLSGAIDIWCSGPQRYLIARAEEERAKGRDYWFYNGGRPAGPAFVYDAPGTDPRSIGWASFKHGIKVYFYWHSVHWRHNSQKQGNRVQNVWADTITFDNRGQPNKSGTAFAHGDGVLMYPGEEKLHPDQDRGIAGPCSSYQMANLRRGLQDHLYLTMARNLGLDTVVKETVNAVVPRVFSDVRRGQPVGFAETGDEYEAARYKLAAAIARAQKK
jgi:hypothetical protein